MHVPSKESHKGENGKLLIIGGSRKYHGAAVLAVLAARRFVDLVYFIPGEKDFHLVNAIKKIPEAIVIHDLSMLPEMDCVLFGVGLGDAKFSMANLKRAKKLVVDGDGLKRVKGKIPRGAVLTPHEGEFRMLFGVPGNERNVKEMAGRHHCIILKKGPVDIVSDGKKLKTNKLHNPGMTKGGTGDVLAGLVAALSCKNDSLIAAYEGARIAGNAGNMLRKAYGYNFCASDLSDTLSRSHKMLMKG